MQQRISFFTIGVQDLTRMRDWYCEKFGWKPLKDSDGICFFKMNGCILGLFPAHELAADIGIPEDVRNGFKGFSLAINFSSKTGVDQTFEMLRKAGVRIVREPEEVFWGGYRGYISDPEDNYWELAYNPYLSLDDTGNVLTHL